MKSLASESKPFQSRSKGEILGQARRKKQLSHFKLKQVFLIDSDFSCTCQLFLSQMHILDFHLVMTGISVNAPATSEDFRRFNKLPNDAENVQMLQRPLSTSETI